MATADVSRRVSSGGAFGYYDGWPTGTISIFGTEYTASFATGLNNTWKVSRELAPGTTVEVAYGQQSADPSVTPVPYLFDVNFTFSGSIEVYGVDVGGLTLTGEVVTITIAGEENSYARGNLELLRVRMLQNNVPSETAEAFVAAVEGAMDAIDEVDTYALQYFNSLDTVDFSGMDNLVDINLTSGMAASSEGGTPVSIGNMVNVTGSAFDDKIVGSAVDNILDGGAGDDWISGGAGADTLLGLGGDDFIFFDAADGANVNGGAGRDVAVALGEAGVTVNMSNQALEVCIVGGGADTITVELRSRRSGRDPRGQTCGLPPGKGPDQGTDAGEVRAADGGGVGRASARHPLRKIFPNQSVVTPLPSPQGGGCTPSIECNRSAIREVWEMGLRRMLLAEKWWPQ